MYLATDCNPFRRPQRAGAIFVLSLCHTPECQCAPRGSFPLIWQPGFCSHCPGDVPKSTGSGSRGGGGLHSWVIPKECGSRKDSSWPGTTSQALHRQQTGTPPPIPSFSVKEASLLSSNYGLRGRLQVWHMSSGLRSYSQGTDVVLPLSLCLAPAHQYLCLVPAHQYLQLTSISHTCQEP